jgi:hypothetical protein
MKASNLVGKVYVRVNVLTSPTDTMRYLQLQPSRVNGSALKFRKTLF